MLATLESAAFDEIQRGLVGGALFVFSGTVAGLWQWWLQRNVVLVRLDETETRVHFEHFGPLAGCVTLLLSVCACVCFALAFFKWLILLKMCDRIRSFEVARDSLSTDVLETRMVSDLFCCLFTVAQNFK